MPDEELLELDDELLELDDELLLVELPEDRFDPLLVGLETEPEPEFLFDVFEGELVLGGGLYSFEGCLCSLVGEDI